MIYYKQYENALFFGKIKTVNQYLQENNNSIKFSFDHNTQKNTLLTIVSGDQLLLLKLFFYNYQISQKNIDDIIIYAIQNKSNSNISIELIDFLLLYVSNIFLHNNFLFKTAMYTNDQDLTYTLLKRIDYSTILKNKGLSSLLNSLPKKLKYKIMIKNL